MMILMSVIAVTVDYDSLFYYNNNIIYSCFNNRNINRKRNVSMKINKIGAKVVIPTIIIFNNFISFHWWCYEIIIIEK